MRTTTRWWRSTAAVLALAAVVAACGGAEDVDDAAEPTADTDAATEASTDAGDAAAPEDDTDSAAAGAVDLAGVCPDPVVVQLDWQPESEHGMIYSLLGPDYEIDEDAKTATGPLVVDGEPTGVDIQIRIGGPPVGFQDAQSLLYQDPDILFGFGRLGEIMTTQDRLPVVGVMATMEVSPYSVYWDPQTYPDVETMQDLGDEGVQVLVGPGTNVWADWYVEQGWWTEDQVFRSDFAKPATFIAAGGQDAEAGFATAEPFLYEFEVADEWGRPVEVELIHDSGFEEYFQVLVVREEDVESEADCLEQLVPVMQQGGAAYIENPDPVHDVVLDLVERYDTGWVYSDATAEFAYDQMLDLGILANGPDGTYGSFDFERLRGLRDVVASVAGDEIAELEVDSVATNAFLDPSVALP